MEFHEYALMSIIFLSTVITRNHGQLSPKEGLYTAHSCTLSSVSFSCESTHVIAFNSLDFHYEPNCSTTCCNFSSSHKKSEATGNDILYVRRECSGKQSCTIDVRGVRSFPDVGQQTPEYVIVQYYCIPNTRIMNICSKQANIESALPLYLTNDGYPDVTKGTETCSCSIESTSCSKDVRLFIIDVDLYLDSTTCEQSLGFVSENNGTLHNIQCGDYYSNGLTFVDITSLYIKITFNNTSTQNQEGFFFIGMEASDQNANITLTCQDVPATGMCAGCSDPTPANGNADKSTFEYNEGVEIACENGYNISGNSTIECLSNNTWTDYPTCDPLDCGNLDVINGQFKASSGTTYGQTASQSCNTGYTFSGDKTVICTDTGKWNGTAAVCTIIDCGNRQVVNGQFSAQSGTTFGQSATQSCNNGYNITGEETVTCTESGAWSAAIAVCTIIDCGTRTIDNGNFSAPSGTRYGNTATQSCNIGYTFSGEEEVTCLASGDWSEAVAVCTIVDCGNRTVDNGNFSAPSGTTYGNTATQSCNIGYTFTGEEVVTCLASGDWSEAVAVCTIVDCGNRTVDNGNFSVPSGTTYGNTATQSCNIGYTFSGEEAVTCLESGDWSEAVAVCTIVDCGNRTVDNGNFSAPSGTTYGNTATQSCNIGYTFSGEEAVTCLESGDWSEAVAVCTIVDCGNRTVDNGNFSAPSGTTYGNTATQSCNIGYTFSGEEAVTCLESGDWSEAVAVCTIVDCGNRTVDNGNFSAPSGTTYGNTATQSCNIGYTFSGEEVVTCLASGDWSEAVAVCTIVDCGNRTIDNGNFSAPSGTTYGNTALQSCNIGYTFSGEEAVTCQESGDWSEAVAVCTIVDCGIRAIDNGKFSAPFGTTYGNTATQSCNIGYIFSGEEAVTCQESGDWSEAVAVCTIVDCGSRTVDNGKFSAPSGTTYGNTATQSCNIGYTFSGEEAVTCQESGDWSEAVANCTIVDCGIRTIDNGNFIASSGTTYRNTATQSCNIGYTFSGEEVVTCLASGDWSEAVAVCTIVDCGNLTYFEGNFSAPSGTTFGQSAILSCNTTTDKETVICTESGEWNITDVLCPLIDCGNRSIVDGSFVAQSGTTFGQIATQLCYTGYTISGEETVICTESGDWNATAAVCTIVDCGNLTVVNGQFTAVSGTTFGQTANQSCNTGYTLSGEETVTCTESGKWNATAAVCTIVDCGNPTPFFGSINDTDFKYGTVLEIACATGYIISGNSTISCMANGNWSDIPNCEPFDCGNRTIVNGQFTVLSETTFGQTAIQSCYSGYILSGQMSVICTMTGWNAPTATCTVVDCLIPNVANGKIAETANGTTFNETAIISCNDGYEINGSSTVTCEANGNWTTLPTCEIRDCGPITVENGNATLSNVTGTIVGDIALVSCNLGYNASRISVSCLPSGHWENVTCRMIDCGNPQLILHGFFLLSSSKSTTYGSSASVVCDDEYESSKQIISCQENGLWETAICVRKEDQDVSVTILVAVILGVLVVLSAAVGLLVLNISISKTQLQKPTYEKSVESGVFARSSVVWSSKVNAMREEKTFDLNFDGYHYNGKL